jgi:CDP-diacylglycerol--glycerol-3-phosphate 3-phosphatidyltransferase
MLGVGIFLGAALTDFLDGHIARSRDQVTRLGQLLDPIADKLLISAALISLVENQLAPAWAVVIIIGREFAVTGLRSIAAADGVVIAASTMGKFKMLVQVFTVALLIASSVAGKPPVANFGRPFPAIEFWSVPELRAAWQHLFGSQRLTGTDWQVLLYTAGRAMLWLVVISSCLSMYGYFRQFYRSVLSVNSPRRRKRATIAAIRD